MGDADKGAAVSYFSLDFFFFRHIIKFLLISRYSKPNVLNVTLLKRAENTK